MSVLVKGMEMPQSCNKCDFKRKADENDYYCRLTLHSIVSKDYEIRPIGCPLDEVPTPHGDLIDRLVIRDNLMYEMVGTGYQSKAISVCDELYTPTVIEAEYLEEE